MIQRVLILGGGSAGFMAALALKTRLPALDVRVVRSPDIGIIGVGEGSTVQLTHFLHQYLRVGLERFHAIARPTWKLGLKFLHWGPRERFFYTFSPNQAQWRPPELPRNAGYYCDVTGPDDPDCDLSSALMADEKAFERDRAGTPILPSDLAFAYHFENERFVTFLERSATDAGVGIVEETVEDVSRDQAGIVGLRMQSGENASADLYVDCSGFTSRLLGQALGEPFERFNSTLFCDRAIVGGWDRSGPDDQIIKPYTTCETMDAGWCWQIEHETRVNRGYVHAGDFVSDEQAEREFRERNPKVGPTRVVRFVSGCYARAWVGNVVAIGNAGGFVEPLEATALGAIAMQSRLLADTLADTSYRPTPTQVAEYNDYHRRNWSAIRAFLSVHYKFNTRLDTPFWRACRADTVVPATAQRVVDYYRENGPSQLWTRTLFDPVDQFALAGYYALLLGQRVPFDDPSRGNISERERGLWIARRKAAGEFAARALTVRETLEVVRSSRWQWA